MAASILKDQNHSPRRARGAGRKHTITIVSLFALVSVMLSAFSFGPAAGAAGPGNTVLDFDQNKRRVTNFDLNMTQFVTNLPSPSQLQALNALKANLNDSSITAKWDKATGSIDVIYDFASQPSQLEPEAAARSFINANSALFGISDLSTLRLKRNTEALGGNLLYFEQTHNGLPVVGGGIGVMMDGQRRIKMVSGPYHSTLSVSAAPSLDTVAAVATAQSDLARFSVPWASGVAEVLNPALDTLAAQLGAAATPHPELNVYPTPQGARLAWKFYLFSRNPFGFFKYQVNALTGQVLYREDFIRYQQPLPLTADIYPTYPRITDELKDQGIISVNPATQTPLDQLRIQLRNFDASNVVTGINGTLTGLHAHIEDVSPVRTPFGQAAKGTWHFRINDPANLEARTNEIDHFGPNALHASHQDGVSQFFYINSLIEYIDYLHVAGDSVHNRIGTGDFPDAYPNQSLPLIGNVHMPNVLNPPTNPSDPEFAQKLLGLDNAFSVSQAENVAGQSVVVNPTSYGHGYNFNNTAVDFGVPYHEGMHSISSPIAGLEGTPEGPALNEAQADLWAYTAAENPVLGAYVMNGFKRRAAVRAAGGNPDLRQWIRHADSGLVYSRLGTFGGAFEEHQDGEIFAAAGWDLRELMLMYETGGNFKRPNLITGEASEPISLGKETWERMFLGAIYVLGSFNPDTFVRARTALILADQALYPSDPTDPDSPGIHRSLIEQVFAAREIGINAEAPIGGRQAISTQVSEFAASQGKLSAPASVTVAPASVTSARVSWQPVAGAFAYEILKREIGKENVRQNPPVFGREYIDGDGSTDGFMHIAYVKGNQSSYVDSGLIEGSNIPRGLKNVLTGEYVVRALNVNANRQVGVSDNSAAASIPSAVLDVTNKTQSAISNVNFAGGKFEFDQVIKNLGAGAFDGTMYTPIEFRIVSISNPSIKVANADNAGQGTASSPASFFYRPQLFTGQTSDARHLVFNNPNAQLFTFDAVITARVQVAPGQGTRYQPEPAPDLSNFEQSTFSEVFTGIVPASDTGLQIASGVTFVDLPFTSKTGAVAVIGRLTSAMTGIDMDLELRDSAGRVISSSGTAESTETVSATIQPNSNYTYRIIGWAGVAQDYSLESVQTLLVPRAGATGGAGAGSGLVPPRLGSVSSLFRFTVNPLTRTVTVQVLRR